MILLEDKKAWERWKFHNVCEDDTAETPTEFPCFVVMRVDSWAAELEAAVYYYKKNLEEMLQELESK